MFDTWNNLTMDELVFHLTAPLEGTNEEMVWQFLDVCVAPAALVLILVVILFIVSRKRKRYYVIILKESIRFRADKESSFIQKIKLL